MASASNRSVAETPALSADGRMGILRIAGSAGFAPRGSSFIQCSIAWEAAIQRWNPGWEAIYSRGGEEYFQVGSRARIDGRRKEIRFLDYRVWLTQEDRRFQSNNTIPAATETFSDEILPAIGMRRIAPQRLRTISWRPFPSPPNTSAAGDP